MQVQKPDYAWTHRIYGRKKNIGRFGALNVSTGNIVGNLIYATCFNEEEAKKAYADLVEQNPEWEFQVRAI